MDQYKIIIGLVNKANIRGVIFDFDGTLADLNVEWVNLKSELQERFNINGNLSLTDILFAIQIQYGKPALETAYDLIRNYEMKDINNAPLKSAIKNLLNFLYGKNIKMGIFSNNMKGTINTFLNNHQISHLIDTIISKEDVLHYKPDPEGIFFILKKWIMQTNQVLFIGNDINDQQAGNKANIQTIIIS